MPNKLPKPSKKILEKLLQTYTDEELNNPKDKRYEELLKLYKQYGIEIEEPKLEHLSFLPDNKKAYPNYDQYMYIPGQRDTKKWAMALKNIQYKQKAGLPYKESIRTSVQGWNKMEIFDFLNWMKYYDEGAPMKYKSAQVWYENGQPGYFLHIKPDAPKEETVVLDSNPVRDPAEEANRQEEKRNVIEKQRSKIIGRLDSAEKLLRSPEGQQFAGTELEQLMEAIYTLKKKVQLVNKISVSTRLYEDMIIREGNVLKRYGFDKAAAILYSIAQTPAQSGQQAAGQSQGGVEPMNGTPAGDPSGAGHPGGLGGLPATIPGVPDINTPVGQDQNKDQPPVDAIMNSGPPQLETQPKGIKEFIENMNAGNTSGVDDLQVSDLEENLIVSEAQAIPPTPGIPPAALEDIPITDSPKPERGNVINLPPPDPNVTEDTPKPTNVGESNEEPLEVTEDDIPPNGSGGTEFTTKMDEMLQGVTVADIVAELEDISKDYKTRSQPRRLSKVDIMLNSVGLAAMFPSLSEAQNKALEANNYISTRVDDILSKLRGAMSSPDKPANAVTDRPDVAGIKGKLQGDQDKEKQRKQMRKEQEASELDSGVGKTVPNVEMGDLAPPATQVPPAIIPAVKPPV